MLVVLLVYLFTCFLILYVCEVFCFIGLLTVCIIFYELKEYVIPLVQLWDYLVVTVDSFFSTLILLVVVVSKCFYPSWTLRFVTTTFFIFNHENLLETVINGFNL